MLNEEITFIPYFFLKRIWNAFTKKKKKKSEFNKKKIENPSQRKEECGSTVGSRYAVADFLAGRARG